MTTYTQKNPWRTYKLGNKGKISCPKCDKTVLMQRLPRELSFKQIKKSKEWKGIEKYDINEILEMIDIKKYEDILENLEGITVCYQIIFIIENILRRFTQNILLIEGYTQLKKLRDRKLNKLISRYKSQESMKKYLPLRGDHDVFYLNLIELNIIFINYWKFFKEIFVSQTWITQRIKDLYDVRNRVAHNSCFLTADELNSVKIYSKQIIKQISDYL